LAVEKGARMLMRNAGLKPPLRAGTLPWLIRTGGVGLLSLGLGGCMTLGDAAQPPAEADYASLPAVSAPMVKVSTPMTAPPVKSMKSERKPQRERRVAENAHPRMMSSLDPDRLIGLAPDAVRQLLGPPVRVESDELSHAWIYASGGCSFRLFFYPSLNTASLRVLKYGGNDDNGDLMDVSDACIRQILAARKNAAG
jgi:hypothetical protein